MAGKRAKLGFVSYVSSIAQLYRKDFMILSSLSQRLLKVLTSRMKQGTPDCRNHWSIALGLEKLVFVGSDSDPKT